MNKKIIPTLCPACGKQLRVARLVCAGCATTVEGDFALPVLARLTSGDQDFLMNFTRFNGSLKDLARFYGISYPTVRNRLDALIAKLKALESEIELEN